MCPPCAFLPRGGVVSIVETNCRCLMKATSSGSTGNLRQKLFTKFTHKILFSIIASWRIKMIYFEKMSIEFFSLTYITELAILTARLRNDVRVLLVGAVGRRAVAHGAHGCERLQLEGGRRAGAGFVQQPQPNAAGTAVDAALLAGAVLGPVPRRAVRAQHGARHQGHHQQRRNHPHQHTHRRRQLQGRTLAI
jgi:hypothetical protein